MSQPAKAIDEPAGGLALGLTQEVILAALLVGEVAVFGVIGKNFFCIRTICKSHV